MRRTRLTLPMRFGSERKALNVIRDNGLFNIGAQAIDTDGPNGWRVIIDTHKPDAVCLYLAQGGGMPGIEWAQSDLP